MHNTTPIDRRGKIQEILSILWSKEMELRDLRVQDLGKDLYMLSGIILRRSFLHATDKKTGEDGEGATFLYPRLLNSIEVDTEARQAWSIIHRWIWWASPQCRTNLMRIIYTICIYIYIYIQYSVYIYTYAVN